MSLTTPGGGAASTSFPRVSGDEPVEGLVGVADLLFSPRERG